MWRRYAKRPFDLGAAIVVLILVAPLFAMAALVVFLAIGRPVLFKQSRVGIDGRTFLIYKFRTMTSERDSQGDLLPDAQRLTRATTLLRRTSLDELPELLNVVKGDMSLVGPRPLLVEYLPLYTCTQARRHEVRPGLTGLAQISGRNNLPWTRRFELDVWYVDHQSFWLDMRILMSTAWMVLTGAGVSEAGHATATKFSGRTEEH